MDSGKSWTFLARITCHFNDSASQLIQKKLHMCTKNENTFALLSYDSICFSLRYSMVLAIK